MGPLGRKNSASSRPVAYPPPMTTALKANPGRMYRCIQLGRWEISGFIAGTGSSAHFELFLFCLFKEKCQPIVIRLLL